MTSPSAQQMTPSAGLMAAAFKAGVVPKLREVDQPVVKCGSMPKAVSNVAQNSVQKEKELLFQEQQRQRQQKQQEEREMQQQKLDEQRQQRHLEEERQKQMAAPAPPPSLRPEFLKMADLVNLKISKINKKNILQNLLKNSKLKKNS